MILSLSVNTHSFNDCISAADSSRSRKPESTLRLQNSLHQQNLTMRHSPILSTVKSYRTPRRNPPSTIFTPMSRPTTIMKILSPLCTPNCTELESNEVKYFIILVTCIFACNEFAVIIGGQIAQTFVGAQHPVILTSFPPFVLLESSANVQGHTELLKHNS